MSNRRGKIARLPFAVREELNQRLLDNQNGIAILEWVNAWPEVVATDDVDGQGPFNQ